MKSSLLGWSVTEVEGCDGLFLEIEIDNVADLTDAQKLVEEIKLILSR